MRVVLCPSAFTLTFTLSATSMLWGGQSKRAGPCYASVRGGTEHDNGSGHSALPNGPVSRQGIKAEQAARHGVVRSTLCSPPYQSETEPAPYPTEPLASEAPPSDSLLPLAAESEQLGDRTAARSSPQLDLFRQRFVVSHDFLIRMPLESNTMLRAFVALPHLSGCIQTKVEAFRPRSTMRWSEDAERMLSLPNAGGSSLYSECLSFEMLSRAFGATLERTEMEARPAPPRPAARQPVPRTAAPKRAGRSHLRQPAEPASLAHSLCSLHPRQLSYVPGSKITDFAVNVYDGARIGVSVTRAFKFR